MKANGKWALQEFVMFLMRKMQSKPLENYEQHQDCPCALKSLCGSGASKDGVG